MSRSPHAASESLLDAFCAVLDEPRPKRAPVIWSEGDIAAALDRGFEEAPEAEDDVTDDEETAARPARWQVVMLHDEL